MGGAWGIRNIVCAVYEKEIDVFGRKDINPLTPNVPIGVVPHR